MAIGSLGLFRLKRGGVLFFGFFRWWVCSCLCMSLVDNNRKQIWFRLWWMFPVLSMGSVIWCGFLAGPVTVSLARDICHFQWMEGPYWFTWATWLVKPKTDSVIICTRVCVCLLAWMRYVDTSQPFWVLSNRTLVCLVVDRSTAQCLPSVDGRCWILHLSTSA